MDYIKRATSLADQCNNALEKELQNRFLAYMTDGDNRGDEPL